MHKAIAGALIGGAVGGGVAAFQASRQQIDNADQPSLAGVAGKGAVQGAAAGALVGAVMERRSRRAAAAEPAQRTTRALARKAKPVLSSVVEEHSGARRGLRPAVRLRRRPSERRHRGRRHRPTACPAVRRAGGRSRSAGGRGGGQHRAAEAGCPRRRRARKRASKAADVALERADEVADLARPVVREGRGNGP